MQLYEKIANNVDSGELYGVRTVEIIEHPGEKPIRMRVNVSKKDPTSITVTGKLNLKQQWLGSSPEDQQRFIDLYKRSPEIQQPVSMTILPPEEYKADLAAAGWITSAYLMAFYTLGYRYILHPEFEHIREYIIASFNQNSSETLVLPATNDFHIYTDETVNSPDPVIRMKVPLHSKDNVCLEICFLRYEVSLPILLAPNVFPEWLSMAKDQLADQPHLAVAEGQFLCLYDIIHCTKTMQHICVYDYLLGKPLPNSTPPGIPDV